MNRADILLKNVNELIANDFAEARQIVNETIANEDEATLVELNSKQLEGSIRSDGEKTKPYKSDTYRRKYNKPANRNYKLEGDFVGSLNAKAEQGKVQFYALDEKASFLEEEEDFKLLGLTDENKELVVNKNINKIRNDFQKRIKRGT